MHRILSLIVILTLAAFVPAGAQERAGTDTSALGRQAEGIPTEADPSQVQAPDTDPNLTTREGIETPRAGEYAGQEAGQTGQTEQAETGQTGVTERAAQTDQRETTEYGEEGGAMPTTASSLPLIGLAGLLALGLGIGLRVATRRS